MGLAPPRPIVPATQMTDDAKQLFKSHRRAVMALFRTFKGKRPPPRQVASFADMSNLMETLSFGDFLMLFQELALCPQVIPKPALTALFNSRTTMQECSMDQLVHCMFEIAQWRNIDDDHAAPAVPASSVAATAPISGDAADAVAATPSVSVVDAPFQPKDLLTAQLESFFKFIRQRTIEHHIGPKDMWEPSKSRCDALCRSSLYACPLLTSVPAVYVCVSVCQVASDPCHHLLSSLMVTRHQPM